MGSEYEDFISSSQLLRLKSFIDAGLSIVVGSTCLMFILELTATLLEDNGATKFVEALGVETRPVNGHCVLRVVRGK